jgi:hypothetical protein
VSTYDDRVTDAEYHLRQAEQVMPSDNPQWAIAAAQAATASAVLALAAAIAPPAAPEADEPPDPRTYADGRADQHKLDLEMLEQCRGAGEGYIHRAKAIAAVRAALLPEGDTTTA